MNHRRSIRLAGYDYTNPGAYFVTICTRARECLFGEFIAGQLRLNALGRVAEAEWERLAHRFEAVILDAHIVMPNHVHGIIQITDDVQKGIARAHNEQEFPVSRHAPSIERFGKPVPGSIPTIIRSYKSAVTLSIKRLHQSPVQPVWQRNYYEHIIRNEKEWLQIRDYIQANPAQWEEDAENPARKPKVHSGES